MFLASKHLPLPFQSSNDILYVRTGNVLLKYFMQLGSGGQHTDKTGGFDVRGGLSIVVIDLVRVMYVL